MATITVTNGELQAAPDTAENTVSMKDALTDETGCLCGIVQIIAATVGVKFGLNEIKANAYAWPTGSKFPFTWKPGSQELVFQGGTIGDTFVITV